MLKTKGLLDHYIEVQIVTLDNFGYDQYETCIPLRLAGECMREFAAAMVDDTTGQAGNLARGFRSQAREFKGRMYQALTQINTR
jgi:hypothetical protein